MWFAFDLIDDGQISPQAFVSALRHQMRCRRPLGQMAVERGLMTMAEVFNVLTRQSETNEPFGHLAVQMGYINREQLSELIISQLETMPRLEDILVESGVIDRTVLDDALVRLRAQLGVLRERQFEGISEALDKSQ